MSQADRITADNTTDTRKAEHHPWELYLLVAGLLSLAVWVIWGNSPRISPWFIVLLAIATGQALMLPASVAWLSSLACVVLWVLFRQVTGIWTTPYLGQSIIEMIGLGLLQLLTNRYSQHWHAQQQELAELRELKQLIMASDVGTGLLPFQVAELRLLEEVDRARLFHRPLGLLLVEITPLPEQIESDEELDRVVQAMARQLVSSSFVHDIPFRIDANHIGLILPERQSEKLYEDTDMLYDALQRAAFLDAEAQSRLAIEFVEIKVGLGTYQGEVVVGSVDLMQAAEDSLKIGRELAGLEGATSSAFAMPTSPIIESDLLVIDTEE